MAVRRVQESDIDSVVALVHELAGYERASEHCRLTAAQLHEAMFGAQSALFGHIADKDGDVAGVALWFQWSVLDWNEPAIGFYRRLGAAPMQDWTVFRIDGHALTALAAPGGRPQAPELNSRAVSS